MSRDFRDFISACQKGKLEKVRNFIENGIDPTRQYNRAIIEAVDFGHIEVVKFLISKGVDVQANNNDVIAWSTINDNIDMVKYLVSIGADPRAQNNNPLLIAVQYGYFELVKYLISVGADFKARNFTALISASSKGHIDIVKYLVSTCKVDVQVENNNAIKYASIYNKFETVQYLISVGADWKRCTPKHKEILKAEQIQSFFLKKKFKNISKNLLPVYFAPNYIGGKLAKKELKKFCNSISIN